MSEFAYFLITLAVFSTGFVAGFGIGIEVQDAPMTQDEREHYERDL